MTGVRVLIDYRPALRSRTGVGAYVHQLSRALARRPGVALTVFSSSWKDRLPAADLVGRGIEVVDRRIPVHALNFAWHRLGWPPAEWVTGRRFDVVHSPHPLRLPARGAASIVTINDLDFLTHPERVRAEIRRDYPSLAREHAHRADGVIAISRYTAREAQRLLGVPEERISVCYPGVPDWVGRRSSGPASVGRPRHILFVGTLEPRKNVGALLDAYGRLLARTGEVPDLVLAGQATAAASPWLEAISRAPLAGRVRHLGYVADDDLPGLYDAAVLLVLPSYDEGFGIPVLEAMAVGVPVVAADRGALPEVLGDAGLLVDPNDAEALAAAMARMLAEPGLAAQSVAMGREQARRFDWDATAEAVEAAYEHAIRRRADRTRGKLSR